MLKVGIIGCGFMGSMHANCYKTMDGVKVTAVADLDEKQAQNLKLPSDTKYYSDGMDLINNEDLDIIDICLPTYLHTKYALAAMEKVGYVFIEKPVALTKDEAKQLLEKQKQTGCRVQVGQVIRFWDEYEYLKEVYDTGKYGKLVNATFRRLSPKPTWSWDGWILDTARSGGAAQDLHIHDADFLLHIFGEPKNSFTIKNKIGLENSYINTICEYGDFVASVEGTWDLPGKFNFEMSYRAVFEKGVLNYTGGKLTVYESDNVFEPEFKKVSGGYEGGNISELGAYLKELEYFCSKARTGKEIERATLKDAAKSLDFVLKEIETNA